MDDHDERDSGSKPFGARVRSALGAVRQQGAASLRGVRRSAAGATDRLKSSQAAERLGAAVEIRRVVKKAADAQQRGNHPMAYRLLEPEVRENPDDARVVVAFWQAALACERADDAVPAVLRIIRKLASTDKAEQAAELWLELRDAAPSALVDPGALVRIASALEAEGRLEQVTLALREAVDPRNDSGLSPGLSVRIAEMARQLDPPTALTAARRALTSPDLHEAKRARLEGLVAELEKAEAEAGPGEAVEKPTEAPPEAPVAAPAEDWAAEALVETPPAPAEAPPTADEAPVAAPAEDWAAEALVEAPVAAPAEDWAAEALVETPVAAPAEDQPAETPAVPAEVPIETPVSPAATDRAIEEVLEALAPAARFSDIKVTEAMPTKLREEALTMQVLAGRKVGVDFAKIEAVAVAEVGGLANHPVVVIDLLFNWGSHGDSTLRVVRLRSDGFDPRMIMAEPTDDPAEAFRGFLSELLARSEAMLLPDSDGALSSNAPVFEDLATYQREVLCVGS
jgi:tetratricopeptide (TPR) repeat protein